jgi:hypothetical protein
VNINIGKANGKDLKIDIDMLLRTRMLIQANSGGGKSWLLRRLLEQAFGKVQCIVIDPAGEFPSLREKYGFVLVGEKGETPADIRSAHLVAQRLLELKASTVCDLYQIKPIEDRHVWVRNFLKTMMNAPKKLWHPVLVVVDEAHKFCPEKGEGESVAKTQMLELASDGRKYGFCAIFATQRLAKMDKSAAAELLNVVIGPTFIDLDLERAHKALGILRSDYAAFDEQMKTIHPGNFWGLGRAISTHRVLIGVGPVNTTHPEAGTAASYVPPPPPDKIKAMLPKLSDLPKEAEEKQRTVETMQKEIRELKVQLRQTQQAKPVTVPTISQQDRISIQRIERERLTVEWDKAIRKYQSDINNKLSIVKLSNQKNPFGLLELPLPEPPKMVVKTPENYSKNIPVPLPVTVHVPAEIRRKQQSNEEQVRGFTSASDGIEKLAQPQQRILNAIAWFESIGITQPQQTAVAFLAGYTATGGGYCNPRGWLKTNGMVEYLGDKICFTEAGRSRAQHPDTPLTTGELHDHIRKILPSPERRILDPLLGAYPSAMSNEDVATKAGYEVSGGGYLNPRGRLKSLGLIEYISGGQIRAKDFLFLGELQ